MEKVIYDYKFKNSQLNPFIFWKCDFVPFTFENCQIVKSGLTRAEFHNSNFINCEFLQSARLGNSFWTCEFRETAVKQRDFNTITATDIKVKGWKSDE